MSNTITKIRKFSKFIYIIAKIIYICCIIGLCGCAAGVIWALVTGSFTGTVVWGGMIIHGPVSVSDARTVAEIWGSFAFAVASLAFTISIARIAMRLFGNMRTGDTPFTMENAMLWRKMGIVMIITSVVPQIIGQTVGSAIATANGIEFSGDYGGGFSLLAALAFFVMSIIFKYGCELQTQIDETL